MFGDKIELGSSYSIVLVDAASVSSMINSDGSISGKSILAVKGELFATNTKHFLSSSDADPQAWPMDQVDGRK